MNSKYYTDMGTQGHPKYIMIGKATGGYYMENSNNGETQFVSCVYFEKYMKEVK